MAKNDILVDLERCVGCWTCAFGCKFGYDLGKDDWLMTVRTLGSGEGIDKPAGKWPKLHMEWMPVWSTRCTKCPARVKDGEQPYCVQACPTGALSFGDVDDSMTEAGKRYGLALAEGRKVYTLPGYESTKDGVVYIRNQKRDSQL